MVDLDQDFVGHVLVPLKVSRILALRELPDVWSELSNQELIELCIEFSRLEAYGYPEEARTIHRAVDVHGLSTVSDFLAKQI